MLRFLFASLLFFSVTLRANEAVLQSLRDFSTAYANDETRERNDRFYTHAQALAKMPGAAPALIEAVRIKNVHQVRGGRALAITALGYCVNDRQSAEPFLVRCAKRSTELQGYALEALGRMGTLKDWLETIADPIAPRARRLEALQLIEQCGAKHTAQTAILRGIDDLDDAIREACLRSVAFGYAPPGELLPRARRALNSLSTGVRAEAARCIVHQGSVFETLELARKLLAEPEERVRLSYLDGFREGYSSDERDGADLLLQKDPSPNVRAYALHFCSEPAWFRAMNDADYNVRLQAFKRGFESDLRSYGEGLPVSLLVEMMQENKATMTPAGCLLEVERIQDLAARVLRNRAYRPNVSTDALKTQLRALLDPRQSPRTMFLAAGILLSLLPPGDAIDLYETRDPRVLAEIARASTEFLSLQGDAVAFAVLRLLRHPDPAVATAAGEALRENIHWSSSSWRIHEEASLLLGDDLAPGVSRIAALRMLYPYPGKGDTTLALLTSDPAIGGEQDGFPLPLAAVALTLWTAAPESKLLWAMNDANPHMRRAGCHSCCVRPCLSAAGNNAKYGGCAPRQRSICASRRVSRIPICGAPNRRGKRGNRVRRERSLGANPRGGISADFV